MKLVSAEKLRSLQKNISQVRNICILAHVDHGKTTLADSLVASNGIISSKMAGKLRYMDSRPDEQDRGITMKSSCISLFYESEDNNSEYLINLIDSPGHVDFSSEVSTAVRLCDGTIILVDVLEGVGSQTRICLKQAYTENLKPVLVLNKIDRLILEKQMTPLDAYIHIMQVLEQVNAAMGNVFASDVFSKETIQNDNDYTSALEEADDSNLYFTPESGNVIFCSAIHGWGFTVRDFAKLYAGKLGIDVDVLVKALWGNFYYNAKEKRCVEGAQEKAKKPLFVQLILENIWTVYENVVIRRDKDKIPLMVEKLGIKLTTRDLKHTDGKYQLQVILSQWLPVEKTILERITALVSQPGTTDEKAERLMCSLHQQFDAYPPETRALKSEFVASNSSSENVIVFISKMIPINASQLPENKTKPLNDEEMRKRREMARQRYHELQTSSASTSESKSDYAGELISGIEQLSVSELQSSKVNEEKESECDEVFLAFARVYSGTLRPGMKLFVLSPKHDPKHFNPNNPLESKYISEVSIDKLYMLMGRDLHSLDEVPAGNIVGISGLQDVVLKTATLTNNPYCPSFTELTSFATPILRVAIEPVNPLDMSKLIKGLKLLNQADACVQVLLQETGEHVVLTLGEVHLEKCVCDLEHSYAKIKVNVSKPIVPFRETIVPPPTVDMVNEAVVQNESKSDRDEKFITIQTANKQATIQILAIPLDKEIVDLLDKHLDVLKMFVKFGDGKSLSEHNARIVVTIKESLKELFKKSSNDVLKTLTIEQIWSLGPKGCGTNILFNVTNFEHLPYWKVTKDRIKSSDLRSEYENSFINGFQLATLGGPLCEEPMQGVGYVIQQWSISDNYDQLNPTFGSFSGQIISTVRDGCRKAFQNQPQRLVTPMYSCNIVVSTEVLGKMYAVIGRRNGKILASDLTQGSGNFSVTAQIPVIESFNLAQEIRKQTSGLACPQLVFSHWETIDIDPFWVPSTEEEYLHFGEKADTVNRAKVYMDSVRKRKGLFIEEKIVEHAEKQRTLSKNK